MPPAITLSRKDVVRLQPLLSAAHRWGLPGADALQSELNRADVVAPRAIPAEIVTMNSRVRFIEEFSGIERELTLVYPFHVQDTDHLSVLSPVGSALLGLSIGQSIDWTTPSGDKLRLRVLAIPYQPEAAGEFQF